VKQSKCTLEKQPLRFFMKRHPRAFISGITALFFTNLFDVLTPLGLKVGIDALEKKDHGGLLHAIGLYLVLMIGVTICRYLWRVHFGRFHYSVAEDLRNRIFAKFTELGPSYFQKKPVGELMSLLINDVNAFRMAIGPGVLILLDAAFLIAMIAPVMLWLSFSWTWKTMIFVPIVPFIMRRMEALINKRFHIEQEALSEVSAHAQEIVSGIRVIKSFAQEGNQVRIFNRASRKFELACNGVAQADSAFQPAMDFVVATGSVVLLYYCSNDVVLGTITLGTFVAFHEYIRRMVSPMSALGVGASMVEQGRASFARICDLLSTESDIPDNGTETIARFSSLEVRHLTFRYPGAPTDALKNLSFKIKAGETIGIVGPVGAGKTTLLQLLCRLYPTQTGEILVNGIQLPKYTRASLATAISYVPQEAFLFSDTVAENVAFGFDGFPGLDPVEHATSCVNIDHEVRSLPFGYESHLGERGVNLSGGQKQRLTIARALIRNSSMMMLDDSLSAVDGKTERAIVQAMQAARREDPTQTVLIVSHRLATLKHADRILVLNQGALEAEGSHDELLVSCKTYRVLHDLQTTQSDTFEAASLEAAGSTTPARAL
jgi:ATP-binding cassette, subfamily B, multidrug efflux pump